MAAELAAVGFHMDQDLVPVVPDAAAESDGLEPHPLLQVVDVTRGDLQPGRQLFPGQQVLRIVAHRTVLRRRLEDLDLILEQLKEAIAADADPMLRWWQARRTLLGLLAPYPKKTAGGRRPRDSQAGDGKQIGNGGKRKKGGRKR